MFEVLCFFIFFKTLFIGCAESLLLSGLSLVVSGYCSSLWDVSFPFEAQGLGLMGFRSCCSQALEHRLIVVAYGLSSTVACGIPLDQGLNPCLLHWEKGSFTTETPRKPQVFCF